MLFLENGYHVFQRETLTRNRILETEEPDFPDCQYTNISEDTMGITEVTELI